MSAADAFHLGVSLYSFTTEFWSYKWSFEDLMRKAGQLGAGQGIEIVGPQHHRGFPNVPEEFVRTFRSSCERNNVVPVSYGAYADPFTWPDRDFTADEMVEYMTPQLKGAAQLGFPKIRLQYFNYTVIERLLPYAKKYKLKLGYEVHQPIMVETPLAQTLIEQVKKISSEYLGLIPDFGIFEKRTGMPQMPGMESPPPSPPSAMAQLLPYTFHIHGKFHRMVNGEIPDVPFDELIKVLVEGGYKGSMSTEFEGSNLGQYPDSFEIVKLHQALVRRCMAKYSKK
jgi:sugar phosphate isomerase/epimerase